MKNEQINLLIELSKNFEEANSIIEEKLNIKDINEKIKYLYDNFDVEIISRTEENLEVDYICLLTSIINQKFK